MARVQSLVTPEKGTVVVTFALSANGRVDGSPMVARAEPQSLQSPARQAVLAASPFPPFPAEMGDEPRTFEVEVRYE